MAEKHDSWMKGLGIELDKLRGQSASSTAATDAAVDASLKHGNALEQKAIADLAIPDAAKAGLSAYANFSTGVTQGAYQGLKAVAGAAQSAADAVTGVGAATVALDVVTAPVSDTARQDLTDDLAKASTDANLVVDPIGSLGSAAATAYERGSAAGDSVAQMVGKGIGFVGVVATAGALGGGAAGADAAAGAGADAVAGADAAASGGPISPMATTGVMPAVNVGGDVTAAGGAGAAAAGGPISPMATTGVMPAVNVGGDVAAGAAGADAAAGSGADASAGGGEMPADGDDAPASGPPTVPDPKLEEGVAPTDPAPPVKPEGDEPEGPATLPGQPAPPATIRGSPAPPATIRGSPPPPPDPSLARPPQTPIPANPEEAEAPDTVRDPPQPADAS